MNQTIGKRFPDLEMAADDGKTIKLSEIAGKFPLILIFYRGYW
jgi:peroxiredoxin